VCHGKQQHRRYCLLNLQYFHSRLQTNTFPQPCRRVSAPILRSEVDMTTLLATSATPVVGLPSSPCGSSPPFKLIFQKKESYNNINTNEDDPSNNTLKHPVIADENTPPLFVGPSLQESYTATQQQQRRKRRSFWRNRSNKRLPIRGKTDRSRQDPTGS
jgi:hypothetical protein